MRLTFSPIGDSLLGTGGGWVLIVAVAALLFFLLFFAMAGSKLSPRRRRVLYSLRIAVIVLVVLGMLRPNLVHTITLQQSAVLPILIDRSRSMQVADEAGGKTRWDLLRSTLDEALPTLESLKGKLDVQLYTFDSETESLDLAVAKHELPQKPDGKQTALGGALADVLEREAGKRMAGIIILSDGAQRALPPRDIPPQVPARQLANMQQPIYTVPFGQGRGQGQARDLALSDLLVNQQVFVKNTLDVTGQARGAGFANQDVLVQLLFENTKGAMEPVDSVQLHNPPDGRQMPIHLKYVPQLPGEYKVTLRAPPQPGELVTTNNELSTFVTVLKGGLNVLYLNGELLPEQKFLRWSLDSSPDIKVDYVYINAQKPETRPSGLLEKFKPGKYDVYMIGALDAAAFKPEELTALAAAVNGGAGFIMLGGLHSFGAGGYGPTPIGKVLPIEIDRLERQRFDEAVREDLHVPGPLHIQPTKTGSLISMMGLAPRDENAQAWSRLPPVDGTNRFAGIKPGANVLAVGERDVPLIVAKDYGAGRSVAFGPDSTWRWWMAGQEKSHKRFWRQVILWLARKDQSAEGHITIKLDQRRFAPGARIDFSVAAESADGAPLTNAKFETTLIAPGGARHHVELRRQGESTVGSVLDATTAGDYMLEVSATAGGQSLGSARARFLIYEQDLELDNPAADRSSLETLAAMTGGKSIAPEQLVSLLKQLAKTADQWKDERLEKTTLYDNGYYLLILVTLLSVEWYLRKRWGLV